MLKMVQKDKGTGLWCCPESIQLRSYSLMRGRRGGNVRRQEKKLLGKVCVWNNKGLKTFGSRYFTFGRGRS